MPGYISKRASRLTPYQAGEQPDDPNIIKLNTNENPYPPAPGVSTAIAEAVARLPLYPPTDGGALRDAAAALFGIPKEWIFVGNGSDEALALSFLAFFGEDRPIRAPALTYSFYPVYAELFGVPYTACGMKPGLAVDLDALTEGGSVVLANPNAPTSLSLSMGEIEFLAKSLQVRGDLLLLDEAYADFNSENALPLIHKYDNLLIVRTLSKSYSLAGLRIGFALGQPELIRALTAVKDSFNSYPLDHLAIAGGAAALADQEHMHKNTGAIINTRDSFTNSLRALGFTLPDSKTNFVFARHSKMNGEQLFNRLRQQNILVRHFNRDPIRDYLRISIGTPEQMRSVTEALTWILQNE